MGKGCRNLNEREPRGAGNGAVQDENWLQFVWRLIGAMPAHRDMISRSSRVGCIVVISAHHHRQRNQTSAGSVSLTLSLSVSLLVALLINWNLKLIKLSFCAFIQFITNMTPIIRNMFAN